MTPEAIGAVIAELVAQAAAFGIELDKDIIELIRNIITALLARRAIVVATTGDVLITEHK